MHKPADKIQISITVTSRYDVVAEANVTRTVLDPLNLDAEIADAVRAAQGHVELVNANLRVIDAWA